MQSSSDYSAAGDVGVAIDALATYSGQAPFHPPNAFPELPLVLARHRAASNPAYILVRSALANLGLDANRYGTSEWNPMGETIRPGQTVVVCPNGVLHKNFNPQGGVFSVITHGSVIRAVVDYVFIALRQRGRIVIAHAPLNSADFDAWLTISGCNKIIEFYKTCVGFPLECMDLRSEYVEWNEAMSYSPNCGRKPLAGDPADYMDVDLGARSQFAQWSRHSIGLLYGADYDRAVTTGAHSAGKHVYRVAKTVLNADCIVAVPKLKTHMKVGLTVNLKGMVGTQGYKNHIPHFRIGPPRKGGDEYPDCGRIQELLHGYRRWMTRRYLLKRDARGDGAFLRHRWMRRKLQASWDAILRMRYSGYDGSIAGGEWHGNDTAWRMAIDLTKIVLFAGSDGVVRDKQARSFLSVVDGIVGGEGDGPLSPAARQCGAVVCGCNPVAVDVVCARLMGFDPRRIALTAGALRDGDIACWRGGIQGIRVNGGTEGFRPLAEALVGRCFGFAVPRGWRGAIEETPVSFAPEHAC